MILNTLKLLWRQFKNISWRIVHAVIIFISNWAAELDIICGHKFTSLAIFEIRKCTQNAFNNIGKNVNSDIIFKNKNELWDIYKKYGIYPIKIYKENLKENSIDLTNVFWPLILSIMTGFVGMNIPSSEGVLKYIFSASIVVVSFFFFTIAVMSKNIVNNDICFLNTEEIIGEFVDKYKYSKFNNDCFSQSDVELFNKNIFRYLRIINKIERIEENHFYFSGFRNVDIFNLDDSALKDKYKLNESQIIVYNEILKLRKKFFENNSIK